MLLFERYMGEASAVGYRSVGYQAVHFESLQDAGATPFRTLMRGNSYFVFQPTAQPVQTRDQILGDKPVSEPIKQSSPGSSSTGSMHSQASTGSTDSEQSSPVEVTVGSPESWLQRQSRAVFSNRNSNSGGTGRRGRGRVSQCRALASAAPPNGALQQMHFDVTVVPGDKPDASITRTQYTRIYPSPAHALYNDLGFSSMDLLQVLYVEDAKESNNTDKMLQFLVEGDEGDPDADLGQFSEGQISALQEFRRRARRAVVQQHGEYIDGLWGISCGWVIDALYDIESGNLSLEMTHSDQNPILLVPIPLNQVPEVLMAGLQNLNVSAELLAGMTVAPPFVLPMLPAPVVPPVQPVQNYDEVPLENGGAPDLEDSPTVSSDETTQTSSGASAESRVAEYDDVALDETDEGQGTGNPWDLLVGNEPITAVRRRGYELMQSALRNNPPIQDREYQLRRVRLEIKNNDKLIPDREQRKALLEQFNKAINGEIVGFRLWGINVVPKTCKDGKPEEVVRRDDEDPGNSGAGGSGSRSGSRSGKKANGHWSREGQYVSWQPSSASGSKGQGKEAQDALPLLNLSREKVNNSDADGMNRLAKGGKARAAREDDFSVWFEKGAASLWQNSASQ
ncbi:MAG: hypothetical protein ACR2PX_21750 [Endozoicomonas sp.]|uniref:hypothetical protein n=1 Tax=Endozoicomonas sp. TaxID=1892382 RepID=UPI003D9BCE48